MNTNSTWRMFVRKLRRKARIAARRHKGQLRFESLEPRLALAAFTPGDLAVLRVGGTATDGPGGAALADKSTAAYLDEYTPAGAYVQTIALPTAVSGANQPLTLAGSASAEGELNLSTDGRFLLLTGFNTGVGTSAPDSGSSGIGDTIAVVNASGSVDTTTALAVGATGGVNTEPRGAFSADGTNIYLAGQDGTTGGARYINGLGSTTSTNLSGTALKNIRDIEVWNGQLFIAQNKAAGGDIATLGVAAPTTSGQTAGSLSGLPSGASGTADKTDSFFFARIGTGATFDGFDTLYVADGATPALTKYTYNGTAWAAHGTIGTATSGYEGLTGSVNGTTVTLYATNSSGLVSIVDSSGFGNAINGSPTTVASFPANTAFRGVAFVPQAAVATTTSISSITPLTANQGQSITFTATVAANSGSAAPAGGAVEFFNGGLGGTLLATATAENTSGATGTYTVSSTTVPAGTYNNIQAFYVGSNGFIKSNSVTFGSTLAVTTSVGTSTSISSITPLTSNVGTPITFTATVSALTGSTAPGAGSVAFYSGGTGGTLLATANSETTSGTTATFTVSTSTIAGGNYSNIQAFYTPSTGFGSSNSTAFGSTLQVNVPGVIAAWTFPTAANPPDNSPSANIGTGAATTLGMTNSYNGGNTASDDVVSTSGTADPNFTENTWRVRGTGHNGWATYQNGAGAPQYSQGAELDTSTVGYSNIVFSFDWYSTTQGIRDLQVQYNTDTTNPNGWVNYQGPSPTGTFVASSNDYYNAGLSPVNPTIHINLSGITAANNDPHLGIRLVSAFDSTGTLGNEYASAASSAGDIVPYNNSSGNWRFANLMFQSGITTTTSLAANPPGGQTPGQNATFTATVTAASGTQFPSGAVNFYDGSKLIGSQAVSQTGPNVGRASISTNTLAPGIHGNITAQYTPASGNGLIASGSSMNLVAGDPTDNPISYTINAPQATGVDISPVVGQPFTGVVATFSDGTITSPTGFSASINWGDGHTTSTSDGNNDVAIAFIGTKMESNINGQEVPVSLFTVTGTNTYAAADSFPISVTITDPNSNFTTVNPTARVAYAPLAVKAAGTLNTNFGASFSNQTVATFTDPGLVANLVSLGISDPTTQFTATINWGDGNTAAGTIAYDAGTQQFSVVGSHGYTQAGNYPISVAVTPSTLSVERIDSSDPTNQNLVGDENGNKLTDAPSADFIDQFVIAPNAPTQTAPLYTTSLPTVSSTGNVAFTNSSYSVSEGNMTLSTNGLYLVTGGYDATVSAWAPQQTFSDASVINRVIGTVDGNGNINTTTTLTDAYSGDNFRGVASTDGTQFWTSGHAGGGDGFVHYAQLGATSSTMITDSSSTPYNPSNINTINIFNGQLYEGVRSVAATAPAGIYQIGTGLPTTAGANGQNESLFIQVPQGNPLDLEGGGKPMTPFAFWMTNLPGNTNSINGVNVAYIADAEMGISRYDYTGAGWQFSYYIDSTGSFKDSVYTVGSDGSVTPTASFNSTNPIPTTDPNADPSKAGGVKGLTGRVVNGQVQLFAVGGFGTGAQPHPGGSLIEVTDTGANSGFTTLATNPTSDPSELTGVAFSPTAVVTTSATVDTLTMNPSNANINVGQNTSFSAASSNPTGSDTVQWYVSTNGGAFNSISNGGVYSGATTTTLTLTNPAASFSGNQYEAVFSNAAGTLTTSTAALTVDSVTNPAAASITYGQSTSLIASSANPTGTDAVQWEISTDGGHTFNPLSDGGIYSGSATTTLALTQPPVAYSGYEYEAIFTNSAGTLTAGPATLTVTPFTPTVTYSPDASGSLTHAYDGNAHTETATIAGVGGVVLDTETLSATNVVQSSSTSGSFTDASGNYSAAKWALAVTVTPINATVTYSPDASGSLTVPYDGHLHTETATITGLGGVKLDSESLSATNVSDSSSKSGSFTYPSGNYNAASWTLADTITKATATVAVSNYFAPYDGHAHTASVTVTGVNGETVSNSITGTNVADSGSASASLSDPGNYSTPVSGTAVLSITKATASVTVNSYSAPYDGNAHTASVTITGVNGESASKSLTGTNVADSGSVSAELSDPGNYSGTTSGTATLTITKATPAVTYGPDASGSLTVAYDGHLHTETATITGVGGVTLASPSVSGTNIVDSTSKSGSYTDANGNYNPASYALTLNIIVNPNLGVLLLDPSAKGSLSVTGNGGVTVTGGGEIVVDSSSTQAVRLTGNGSVSATEIDAKGMSASGKGAVQGVVDTTDAPVADPFASLPAPSVPSGVPQSSSQLNISSGQVTLQPGLYVGGIKISGQAQVTLAPGIYYLQGGGFSVSGQAAVTGSDVMLYNAPAKWSDSISFTGQGSVNLTGLSGSIYQGIAIFQDRTSTTALNLTGQGNLNIVGSIYAAAATMDVTGNGNLNMTGNSQKRLADHLILADLDVTGNGGVFVDTTADAIPSNVVDYYFASY
jgi:hypothetical protein